jgi:hypothetical protein
MNLNKKNIVIWLAFPVLVVSSLCFLFNRYTLTEKRKRHIPLENSANQLSMEEFLEIVKNREPIDMQIFYVPFSSDASGVLTEEHVFQGYLLNLIVKGHRRAYHPYFESFLHKLSIPEEDIPSDNDFRYCCLIKSKSNKYIRFSISRPNLNILFVNGHPYEASLEIVEAFLKLLPAIDYEQAIKYTRGN